MSPCPCGKGIDHDGDGNCGHCAPRRKSRARLQSEKYEAATRWAQDLPAYVWNPIHLLVSFIDSEIYVVRTDTGKIIAGTGRGFNRPNARDWLEQRKGKFIGWVRVGE